MVGVVRTLPTQRSPFLQPPPPASASQGIAGLPHAPLSSDGTFAGDILKDAVFYIDAKEHQNYGANPKTIRNLGTMRSALDARCGSTSVPDSNDPLFLPWNGANYLNLPGIAGNSITCTAPATATQYIAYKLDGSTTAGSATSGSTFTFTTVGSWLHVDLLDVSNVVLASFNATALTTGSATSQTDTFAVAWTINRATSGRKSVAVVAPVWLFGTDDFMQVMDNPAINFAGGDSFTVFAVTRMWSYLGENHIVGKKYFRNTFTLAGYWLQRAVSTGVMRVALSDGTNGITNLSGPSPASAVGNVALTTFLKSQNTWTEYENTNSNIPSINVVTGSLVNSTPLIIGWQYINNTLSDMELVAVAIFRRALSSSEVSVLNQYYQNKWL